MGLVVVAVELEFVAPVVAAPVVVASVDLVVVYVVDPVAVSVGAATVAAAAAAALDVVDAASVADDDEAVGEELFSGKCRPIFLDSAEVVPPRVPSIFC